MWKFGLMVWSLTAVLVFSPGLRADTPPGAAVIAAILADPPGCGPRVRAALVRAIEAEPSLAKSAVAAAANASPCQQQEIWQALNDAADFFAKISTLWAQAALGIIQSAAASGSPASTVGSENLASPTADVPPPPAVSRCVSPSHAPGGCS